MGSFFGRVRAFTSPKKIRRLLLLFVFNSLNSRAFLKRATWILNFARRFEALTLNFLFIDLFDVHYLRISPALRAAQTNFTFLEDNERFILKKLNLLVDGDQVKQD